MSCYEARIGEYYSQASGMVGPLAEIYDGVSLRELVQYDWARSREMSSNGTPAQRGRFTPAQRAAISAHWSAQLRAKVAASKAADAERERNRVLVDVEDA